MDRAIRVVLGRFRCHGGELVTAHLAKPLLVGEDVLEKNSAMPNGFGEGNLARFEQPYECRAGRDRSGDYVFGWEEPQDDSSDAIRRVLRVIM